MVRMNAFKGRSIAIHQNQLPFTCRPGKALGTKLEHSLVPAAKPESRTVARSSPIGAIPINPSALSEANFDAI